MDEDMTKALIEASNQLAPKVYDDLLQPVMKETGKALETVGKAINAALCPIRWMVYKVDEIDERIQSHLQQKLIDVPPEKISLPAANIVVPTYEALRYNLDNDELKQLFVNLMATSMVDDTKNNAHPAFVEVIKQLSSFEAKLFNKLSMPKEFAFGIAKTRVEISQSESSGFDWIMHIIDPSFGMNLNNFKLYAIALENLQRLELIHISYDGSFVDESEYSGIENGDIVTHCRNKAPTLKPGYPYFRCKRGELIITEFGKAFITACLI